MFLSDHEKQHLAGWMDGIRQNKMEKKILSSKQLLNITALMTRLERTI